MAQNLPRGTPARLLVLLALLTGLVAVSVWRDALQRDRAVRVTYPTALGDTAYFRPSMLPVRIPAGGGRMVQLTLADGKPLRRRDDRMFRVGPEPGEALPFRLYTPEENPAESGDPPLYARSAPGEFTALRAGLQEQEPAPAPAAPGTGKHTPPPVPGARSAQAPEAAAGERFSPEKN